MGKGLIFIGGRAETAATAAAEAVFTAQESGRVLLYLLARTIATHENATLVSEWDSIKERDRGKEPEGKRGQKSPFEASRSLWKRNNIFLVNTCIAQWHGGYTFTKAEEGWG